MSSVFHRSLSLSTQCASNDPHVMPLSISAHQKITESLKVCLNNNKDDLHLTSGRQKVQKSKKLCICEHSDSQCSI